MICNIALIIFLFIPSELYSLHSRRLEVVGERENGRARGRHARGVSRSLAHVFSCAHYFQAPATQAMSYTILS